jgi:hypothetical protein
MFPGCPSGRQLKLQLGLTWLQRQHLENDIEPVKLFIPDEVQVKPDDIIVLIYRSLDPVILRYDEDDGFYRFVTAVLVVQSIPGTWLRKSLV